MSWFVVLWLGCGGKAMDPPALPVFHDDATPTDSGDLNHDSADPSDPDPDFCEDAPLLTWANFGQGFITEACQGCHASATPDRYGAPESVTFDTVTQAWNQADRVLARAAGDYPSMPPLGGTSADSRLKLAYWLMCGESGT